MPQGVYIPSTRTSLRVIKTLNKISLSDKKSGFLMPTTRKQNKARKSKDVDMLSDVGNLYVTLGGNQSKRDESEISNYGRKPESPSYDTLLNQSSTSHPNSREIEIRTYTQNGQSSREADSGSEFNRLSGELNQRITTEMSDLMSTVKRALNEAISDQILPRIQATLKSGQGHMPERRWENIDLKKPWTVGLGATPEMSIIGFQTEVKTQILLMT